MSTLFVRATPVVRRLPLALPALLFNVACDNAAPADSPAEDPSSESCATDMVDDLEDGDSFICDSEGRQGAWYTATDGSGTLVTPSGGFTPTAIPDGRGASRYAARMVGSGFSGWGALMGLNLNGAGFYDASDAGGVSFWMKSTAPVVVSIPIPETIPSSETSGTCEASDYQCYRKFNTWVGGVSTDWVEHRVPFSALRRAVGGDVVWDPKRLVALEFSTDAADFDVWVDDVKFYACDGDECVPTCHEPEFPVACPATSTLPAFCWPEGTDCAEPEDRMYGNAVWGTGPDDVWVAGVSTVTLSAAFLHWNGSDWSQVRAGVAPIQWGLWGSDANDLWSVGDYGSILHWDGSDWSGAASGTTDDLTNGLWGTDPDDVWATSAAGTLLHFDGSSWSETPSGTSSELWGLWSHDENDAWAVGAAGTILRWDGSSWSSVDSGTDRHLDAVWGSAADDVWAVGEAGTILRWDGSVWTQVESQTDRFLEIVWGLSNDDVWAVGEDGVILHWNGSAWSKTTSGTDAYLAGIWGTASDDVWAVGDVMLHWDGSSWTEALGDGLLR